MFCKEFPAFREVFHDEDRLKTAPTLKLVCGRGRCYSLLPTSSPMLFLKRFLTAMAFLPFLTMAIWLGGLVVGGAFAGGKAAAEQQAQGYEANQIGRQAGAEFGRKYSVIILKGAAVTSLVLSVGISFSGILPWCRRETLPPPLY
jgi:hypothetical protein